MTVVEQLDIGARAEMQMAATRDLGFWLAAILWRRRVLKLSSTWCSDPQPKRSKTTLVATVLGPGGSGLSGRDASLTLKTAGGAEAASDKGRACGPGCYVCTSRSPTAARRSSSATDVGARISVIRGATRRRRQSTRSSPAGSRRAGCGIDFASTAGRSRFFFGRPLRF